MKGHLQQLYISPDALSSSGEMHGTFINVLSDSCSTMIIMIMVIHAEKFMQV